MNFRFMRGQGTFMKERGFDVFALSSPGEELTSFGERERVPVHAVEMKRQITPLRDLLALLQIVRYLLKIRPHIVHAHTPKGGLLGTIAAWLGRVPVRIYHIRGLPFTSASGLQARLLRCTEWVSCRLATHVLCVSESNRQLAVRARLCPPWKISVLLNGSGNGVDAMGAFNPARWRHARQAIRSRTGIPHDAMVLGFVGRIVRNKGVAELFDAWKALRQEFERLHLLIVGFFEPHDPLPSDLEEALLADSRIHLTGGQREAAGFYAAMDLVVLPTYREGFPNVPLEAASMGIPTVATLVPGCTDAVVDGVTGLLVPPRDAVALTGAIKRYLQCPELLELHGAAGRTRVVREFRRERVWQALYEAYVALLRPHGVRVPNAEEVSETCS
jgi:glycosyltransferase involved in cell wall biosynthesis